MATLAMQPESAVRKAANPRLPTWLMSALLALITILLYWPVLNHDFINYDDPAYVTSNPYVQAGLSWKGLAWAFGQIHGEGTYWHPLTWVSHMLDCQWHGLKASGHHATNVLLHAANAVLVFLVCRRMTGALWRCALVAALFAVHPLQVDTVAWVSERKNLLAALFWLLTVWAYASVQSPGSSAHGQQSRFTFHVSPWHLLSLAFFTLGLMCKPVLVTLPFALLLLDYWPLRRNAECSWRRLVWEKVPFLALAIVSSAITILAHRGLGMLDTVASLPLGIRFENALVSYARYLGKVVWPSNLAVFYPYPASWPGWAVVGSGVLLLLVSALAVGMARRQPWLVVGWCWFLGVLVPFIGLVQAGDQAMADRFMYLPILGVFLALVWGGWSRGRMWAPSAGVTALLLCFMITRMQLGYWKNSETLFRHAAACTAGNFVAHNSLGLALAQKGKWPEALPHYQQAVRYNPNFAEAHNHLADALSTLGRWDEAIRHYELALQLDPGIAEAYNNLGLALGQTGQWSNAVPYFAQALKTDPQLVGARKNLADALYTLGKADEAIEQYELVLRADPALAEAHHNLGLALAGKGRWAEAIQHYEQALRLDPNLAGACLNLAWLLAVCPQAELRDGARAVNLAQQAHRMSGGENVRALDTLAAAYAEAGRFAEAVTAASRAVELAAAHTNSAADAIRARLQLYQSGTAYHPLPPGR